MDEFETMTIGRYTVDQTHPSEHGYRAYRTEFGPGALFIQGLRADCIGEATALAKRHDSAVRGMARRVVAEKVAEWREEPLPEGDPVPRALTLPLKAQDAPPDHPRWNSLKVVCPKCAAAVGESCVTAKGSAVKYFHGVRFTLANG